MNICIFIPTMNHPQFIDYYLSCVDDLLKKHNCFIYILDTSDNTQTEEVVKKYHSNNVSYEKLENYPDRTTDLKVLLGIEKIYKKYDYIWLCGDGSILHIDSLVPIVEEYVEKGYSFFHFDELYTNSHEGIKIYQNGVELFKELGWYSTYYCATLIPSSAVNLKMLHQIYNECKNTGFMYWTYFYTYLAKSKNEIVSIHDDFIDVNIHKTMSTADTPGRIYEFWIKGWHKAICTLPNDYLDYKSMIEKKIGEVKGWYTIKYLLKLRRNNTLNYESYKKYRDLFKCVTTTPNIVILIIAIMPKYFVELLVGLKELIRK